MERLVVRRAIGTLAVAVVLVGCGAAAPASWSVGSAAPATGGAASTGATPTPSPGLSAAATPVEQPTLAPTPAATAVPATRSPAPTALALGGAWVSPQAGARLTSYTTTLAARPSASGPGVTTFTKVVFSAAWAGAANKAVCTATEPGAGGAWACRADLLARGVPPGKVTLSFDVYGEGVPAAWSPAGPRGVTYAVPPPRPTGTGLDQVEQPDYEGGDNSAVLHRVHWAAPAGYADEFVVYETFDCPRPSTEANSGKPCFVAGTPVDASKLEVRARAAGGARSVEVRLTEFECGPSHGTILLRAHGAYGWSGYAVVVAAPVIWVPPGDQVC
jgi:hypothetical protein